MSNPFDSPFIVPVAGCVMILGLGASGIYSEMRGKEMRSQERIAMLNRGVPLADIERMSVTASGVINLAIGAGFLVDYNMQKRELARFGMEVDSEALLGRQTGL